MDESASLIMQLVILLVVIISVTINIVDNRRTRDRIEEQNQLGKEIIKVLTTSNDLSTDIAKSLPIIKGYAELARIGGSQSREAIKEMKEHTDAIPKIVEKIDELPDKVASKIDGDSGLHFRKPKH